MATKSSKPAGAKPEQQAVAQTPKLPVKASINWLNQKDDSNVRATASLTIGGAFAVHGIKIISGQKGDFVSMPSYKSGDSYKDIFHAVTAEARQQMNDAVMDAYEQKLSAEMSQDTGLESQNQ